MEVKKTIADLRSIEKRFIFQGGSKYAKDLADLILKSYHAGRADAVRGTFNHDYLDTFKGTPEVTAPRHGTSPPNAE